MTQISRANRSRWLLELVAVAAAAFVLLALVQHFVGRMYVVPSASMEPTLHGCPGCTNDRIAVEKLSYYGSDPQPGDVVVFAGEASWNADFSVQRSRNTLVRGAQNIAAWAGLRANDENTFVKRVIATGGQTVACQPGDAGIVVDGTVLTEPYVETGGGAAGGAPPVNPQTGSQACGGDYFGPVTVPEGRLWLMGDNRTNSMDSRAHIGDEMQGTIGVDHVRGKVIGVLAPLSRFGGVNSVDPSELAAPAALHSAGSPKAGV